MKTKTFLHVINLQAKSIFFTSLFKVKFIKEWYYGHELLKNPPKVEVEDTIIKNAKFINVELQCNAEGSIRVIDNVFLGTVKLAKYF